MGDKLLRWLVEHNATISFHNAEEFHWTAIDVRIGISTVTPPLYAGCRLKEHELAKPKALLDAVERLVEQIERQLRSDSL